MIALIGESGGGKTATLMALLRLGYKKIVTYTTRNKREGEVDDIDYHFVSESKFLDMKEHGKFIETACYRGKWYGTAREDLADEKGVLAITPSGFRNLKKNGVHVISFYISVDRRSRLMALLARDKDVDIDKIIKTNVSDIGMFDGVGNEVNYTIDNTNFEKSPQAVALEIAKCCEKEGVCL